jgi:hypothetical protein
MGPRILGRRKPERKTGDERRIRGHSGTIAEADATSASGPGDHGRKASSQVTHRSPAPDDVLLPCCGRPLSEVQGKDRITTDPSQVTCGR